MKLLSFEQDERDKLASLSSGGGTKERLSSVMSATLVLDGTDQTIPFDPLQTPRAVGLSMAAGGVITVGVSGYYHADLSLHTDKSGGAGLDLSIWLECKPFSTGVWELHNGGAMSNPVIFDDGGQASIFATNIDAEVGDEFRVMIKENAGSGSLTTITNTVTLGTLTQYAASIGVYRIGDVTP